MKKPKLILTDIDGVWTDGGMYYDSSVEEMVLGEGYNGYGVYPYSFYSTRIKVLTIPPEIDSISNHAFAHCYQLTRVDLGSVRRVGNYAFLSCGQLTEVIFPENDIIVWDGAFKDCIGLKKVEIPKDVRLCNEVFSMCFALEEVILHGPDPYFHNDTFLNCPIKRLVIKDIRSTETQKIEKMLNSLKAKRGETLTIVCKDKTVKKTAKYDGKWY